MHWNLSQFDCTWLVEDEFETICERKQMSPNQELSWYWAGVHVQNHNTRPSSQDSQDLNWASPQCKYMVLLPTYSETQCRLVGGYSHFRQTWCFQLHSSTLKMELKEKWKCCKNLNDTNSSLPCSAQRHWEYNKSLIQKPENTRGW